MYIACVVKTGVHACDQVSWKASVRIGTSLRFVALGWKHPAELSSDWRNVASVFAVCAKSQTVSQFRA